MEVALLTSRIWEGAYALKVLLDYGLPCRNVLLQKTWWRKDNSYDYSQNYLESLDTLNVFNERQHYTIEELIKGKDTRLHEVKNINNKESQDLLNNLNSDILIVVGSRILKPDVIDSFDGLIINFHTGILPFYRGPHSEFWAMYNNEYDKIGTTIHILDKGIDTGEILARENVCIDKSLSPTEAHIVNSINGLKLLAKVIVRLKNGNIEPYKQDEANATYYSFPSDEQIEALEEKIGRQVPLSFAD